jgi:2-amino-4-hydroxy-6-hydroxymethyldihydropteridine diphosphokinase
MYITRKIDKELSSFSSACYPYCCSKSSCHRYEATVGVGGNVGDMKRRLQHLFFALQREHRVKIVRTSLILKNPPFGYTQQDDFLNSIIILKTSLPPKAFLAYLLRLEKRFGRKRSFANAPRTLDLDIIFFDNRVIQTRNLVVPHPYWDQRKSVVIPLAGVQR